MIPDNERCCATKTTGPFRCTNRGYKEHNGKLYCVIHNPSSMSELRQKLAEKHSMEAHKIQHQEACAKAVDEAGITRPEGLKEVVELCDEIIETSFVTDRSAAKRELANEILSLLSVPSQTKDG